MKAWEKWAKQTGSKQSESFSRCLLMLPPECGLEDDFQGVSLLGNGCELVPHAAANGFVMQAQVNPCWITKFDLSYSEDQRK